MPLWLVALLFLIGLAWIADHSVSRLSGAFTRSTESLAKALESLTDSTNDEDWPDDEPVPSLAERLSHLRRATGNLGVRLEEIERLLQPMAAIAEYRMEKIGWSKFLVLHRKMDEIVELAEKQKRHRKLMRDEHGTVRLVYEDEVATAIQNGWTGPGELSVVLTDVGANTINVIKAVREVTGLGLKEAKDLVDGAPKPIKEGVSKEEAATIKKRFEDVGAKIEVELRGAN